MSFLDSKAKSLPQTPGGQEILPVVQSTLAEVRAIQQRHENGDPSAAVQLKAAQPRIGELFAKISQLEASAKNQPKSAAPLQPVITQTNSSQKPMPPQKPIPPRKPTIIVKS